MIVKEAATKKNFWKKKTKLTLICFKFNENGIRRNIKISEEID